ncbi:alanine/glycine:cation symporter family protein [Oceanobacillus sp. FSL W7-1293]|uniref:alanine/glycine:cation symporter family protein n=1 Tax=Oceanobacillus sp. FSL W7-1293 TaxID=2921699 RepID=UPI0030CAE9E4
MSAFIDWLSGAVWNQYFIFSFLVIGLFFSIMTRFVQVTHLKDMIKLMFVRRSSESGVSSFQAISMSLGSRIGTGNVAGVATAITLGGPGAVFWMWVMSFFGAATSFIEITLSQVYKSKVNGELRGGTPYFIEKGLGFRKLGIIFAILTTLATGFFLMNIQSNTIAASMEGAFGIPPYVIGIILVLLMGLCVFGGVKRIAKTAEYLVPFMAIGYIIVCIIILGFNFRAIPDLFSLIISSAFGAEATFGGMIGAAISWGVQRGFFSNAAGAGSETYEGAAAEVSHPAKQGLVQALAVYVDTWIICSATAFMILITGMYNVEGAASVVNVPGVEAGSVNVQLAVDTVLPGVGSAFMAIALFFFCFTTMITYYYKTESSATYIIGHSNKKEKLFLFPLRIGILIFAFVGAIVSASTAWAMGDIGLGSMAYLNLISTLLLSGVALKVLKDYKEQKKAGKDPVFDPVKLGIKNADYWETRQEEASQSSKSGTKVI